MPFDSSLPADHAQVVAAELRNQFNGLNDLITSLSAQIADLTNQLATLTDAVGQCQTEDQVYALIKANAASRVQNLPPPANVISNPPTQAQVVDIEDYLGQLYNALTEP